MLVSNDRTDPEKVGLYPVVYFGSITVAAIALVVVVCTLQLTHTHKATTPAHMRPVLTPTEIRWVRAAHGHCTLVSCSSCTYHAVVKCIHDNVKKRPWPAPSHPPNLVAVRYTGS